MQKNSTADILPECLIQKILSYLSLKEAIKMSILSKTWLQAYLTLPNLKFHYVNSPCRNTEIVDGIMERYRDGKIHIEKFGFSQSLSRSTVSAYCSSQVFPLFCKWLNVALENGVKDLVLRVPNYSLPISTFMAAKSLRELVLTCRNLTHVSSLSGVANCWPRLRKLSLVCLCLDENMLHALLNNCPLLDSLVLRFCSKLEKSLVLNHQNIKSVYITNIEDDSENQRLIIQAPTLEHLTYNICSSTKLDVVECPNLKSLKLYLWTFDGILHNLISRSRSLKVLNIYYYGSTKKIEAPKDLLLDHIGSIPPVDVLNVDIQCPHLDREEGQILLDALLCSCHPRRLNLHSSYTEIITSFMMYIENSSSLRSKPWHSQLKDVKAFDWKNQPLELTSGDPAKGSFTARKKVHFLLDW